MLSALFVLVLWPKLVLSQLVSSVTSKESGSRYKDIVCTGDFPFTLNYEPSTWSNVLSTQYLRSLDRPSVDFYDDLPQTLAEFCYTIGTQCSEKQDYEGHYIELASQRILDYLQRIKMLNDEENEVLRQRKAERLHRTFAQQYHVIDLCFIKCQCKNPGLFEQTFGVSARGKFPPPSLDDPYIHDFDPPITLARRPEAQFSIDGEMIYHEWGGEDWRPYQRMRKFYDPLNLNIYTKPENVPTCSNNVDMSTGLFHLLETGTGVVYTSAKSLCLHRHSGGHNRTSMGGVCLQNPGNPLARLLSFPYETRAPIFTNELMGENPSLAERALIPGIEAFCRAACQCAGQEKRRGLFKKTTALLNSLRKNVGLKSSGQGQGGSSTSLTDMTGQGSQDSQQSSTENIQYREQNGVTDSPQCPLADCYNPGMCGAGCRCRVQSSLDPTNFSPFTLTARCAITVLGNALVKATHHRNKLNGRDIAQENPASYLSSLAYCPCNMTYVSSACCDSLDGYVWEAPHLKIGELLR